jgi:hypothetical protein
LTEDLRLADDHAIERTGDAEEMTNGLTLAELVEVGLNVAARNGKVFVEETEEVSLVLRLNIGGIGVGTLLLEGEEFDAIACGEDEAFADARLMEKSAGGIGEALGGNGEALADLDGRGVVIDAEEDQAARFVVGCGHGAVNR